MGRSLNLKRGDVVRGVFEYSDLVEGKKRPCLVVRSPDSADVLIAMITSKCPRSGVYVELRNEDFSSGCLPKKLCYIRLDKITTVLLENIEEKKGELSISKFDEVLRAYREIFS